MFLSNGVTYSLAATPSKRQAAAEYLPGLDPEAEFVIGEADGAIVQAIALLPEPEYGVAWRILAVKSDAEYEGDFALLANAMVGLLSWGTPRSLNATLPDMPAADRQVLNDLLDGAWAGDVLSAGGPSEEIIQAARMLEWTAPNGLVFREATSAEARKKAYNFALFFGGNPGCTPESGVSLAKLLPRIENDIVWLCGYDNGLLVITVGFLVDPPTFPECKTLAVTLAAVPEHVSEQNIHNLLTLERRVIPWFPGFKGATYLPTVTKTFIEPILADLFDNCVWSEPDENGMVSMVADMPEQPKTFI